MGVVRKKICVQVLVLVLVGLLASTLALATCVDGLQNNGETGIDCGGPCPACGPDGIKCEEPDFNGDGYGDIIIGSISGNVVVMYGGPSGIGTGGLSEVQLQGGVKPTYLGDLNGDGYADAGVVGGPSGIAIYYGKATGLSATPDQTIAAVGGTEPMAITYADLNNDGYDDLISADSDSVLETTSLRVYLGQAGSLAGTPSQSLPPVQNHGLLAELAHVGHADGDAYEDILFGRPAHYQLYVGAALVGSQGAAALYTGGAGGLSGSNIPFDCEATNCNVVDFADFGKGLGQLGDLNGDGLDDWAIGAPQAGNNPWGAFHIYYGRPSLSFPMNADYFVQGTQDAHSILGHSGWLGQSFAGGDFDGDGYSDVVVGDHGYVDSNVWVPDDPAVTPADDCKWPVNQGTVCHSVSRYGSIFEWRGSAAGVSDGPYTYPQYQLTRPPGRAGVLGFVASGSAWLTNFGYSLATRVDINRDGYHDIITSEPDSSTAGNITTYHSVCGEQSRNYSWESPWPGADYGSYLSGGGICGPVVVSNPEDPDIDNDGFNALLCGGNDCNDFNASIYPGAPEICNNGIDENCNGMGDDVCTTEVLCDNNFDDDFDGWVDEEDADCNITLTFTPDPTFQFFSTFANATADDGFFNTNATLAHICDAVGCTSAGFCANSSIDPACLGLNVDLSPGDTCSFTPAVQGLFTYWLCLGNNSASALLSVGPPAPEGDCTDGVDNNKDGFVDEEDADCNITLSFTLNPAITATPVTGTVGAEDGLFNNVTKTASICDAAGCDSTGGCLGAAIDPACLGLSVDGLPTQSCGFTAGTPSSLTYWACLGENNASATFVVNSPGAEGNCSNGGDDDGDGFTDEQDDDCPIFLSIEPDLTADLTPPLVATGTALDGDMPVGPTNRRRVCDDLGCDPAQNGLCAGTEFGWLGGPYPPELSFTDPATSSIGNYTYWLCTGKNSANATVRIVPPESDCSDNTDNDGDGWKDEQDADCPFTLTLSPAASTSFGTSVTATMVADGNVPGVPIGGPRRLCDYQGCDSSSGACLGTELTTLVGVTTPSRAFTDATLSSSGMYTYWICYGENNASALFESRVPHCVAAAGPHDPFGFPPDDVAGPTTYLHNYSAGWNEYDCSAQVFDPCSCNGVDNDTDTIVESCFQGECQGNPGSALCGASSTPILSGTSALCAAANSCLTAPAWCGGIDNICRFNNTGFFEWVTYDLPTLGSETSCLDTFDNDCDGECDYDSQYCTKGDAGCPVGIVACTPPSAGPIYVGDSFQIYCNATIGNINSLEAIAGPNGSCNPGSGPWVGSAFPFNCSFTTSGSHTVSCGIDTTRSYNNTPPVDCALTIDATPCSTWNDNQTGCEDPLAGAALGCAWAPLCDASSVGIPPDPGPKSLPAGSGTGLCLEGTQTPDYQCRVSQCGATADTSTICGIGVYNDTTCSCQMTCGDNDGDGYNNSLCGLDCNDADPTIYPGAPEICGDGIDQDCSGADASCPFAPVLRIDMDADPPTTAPGWNTLRARLAGTHVYPSIDSSSPHFYGWGTETTVGVDLSNLGSHGPLYGDVHASPDVHFNITLPVKTGYNVSIHGGSPFAGVGYDVSAEGILTGTLSTAGAGLYARHSFITEVTDGLLYLFFDGSPNQYVAGIEVFPASCDYDGDGVNNSLPQCGGTDCDDTDPGGYQELVCPNPLNNCQNELICVIACGNLGGEPQCSDTFDDNCNGERDWDGYNGSEYVSRGDADCPVGITGVSVSNANLCEEEIFELRCTATQPNIRSVNWNISSGSCVWQEWQGNDAVFRCTPAGTGSIDVGCYIDTDDSYPISGQEKASTTVTVDNAANCPLCGDGNIDPPEECDGSVPAGLDCSDYGLPGGSALSCTAGCAIDTSACTGAASCGNGQLDPGEDCDGPLAATCNDLGFSGGTLACNACQFDTSACIGGSGVCGDGILDPGEDCDGPLAATCNDLGFSGGTLACNACQFDTSACINTGTCGDGTVNPGESCEFPAPGAWVAPAGLTCGDFTDYTGVNNPLCSALCSINLSNCCYDPDGDGFGPNCPAGEFDCDQSNPAIFGNESVALAGTCYDGLDNDCDGFTDFDSQDWTLVPLTGADTGNRGDAECSVEIWSVGPTTCTGNSLDIIPVNLSNYSSEVRNQVNSITLNLSAFSSSGGGTAYGGLCVPVASTYTGDYPTAVADWNNLANRPQIFRDSWTGMVQWFKCNETNGMGSTTSFNLTAKVNVSRSVSYTPALQLTSTTCNNPIIMQAPPVIRGRVSDELGRPIPGATVQAFRQGGSQQYQNLTRTDGLYDLNNVSLGLYTMSVSKPGSGYDSDTTEDVPMLATVNTYDVTLRNGSCNQCLDWEGRCDTTCSNTPGFCEYTVPAACDGRLPSSGVSYNDSHFTLCCTGEFRKKVGTPSELTGCMKDLVQFNRVVRYLGQPVTMRVYTWEPCS